MKNHLQWHSICGIFPAWFDSCFNLLPFRCGFFPLFPHFFYFFPRSFSIFFNISPHFFGVCVCVCEFESSSPMCVRVLQFMAQIPMYAYVRASVLHINCDRIIVIQLNPFCWMGACSPVCVYRFAHPTAEPGCRRGAGMCAQQLQRSHRESICMIL